MVRRTEQLWPGCEHRGMHRDHVLVDQPWCADYRPQGLRAGGQEDVSLALLGLEVLQFGYQVAVDHRPLVSGGPGAGDDDLAEPGQDAGELLEGGADLRYVVGDLPSGHDLPPGHDRLVHTRLSTIVSAARNTSLMCACSGSPQGNGCQKLPCALAMQPLRVLCMWTTTLLIADLPF